MGAQGWLRRYLIPLLALLVVVGITVAIFLYRDQIDELGNYNYLGAFLISLAANATIILPVPGPVILFALGAVLPSPTLVGLAGGAGAAIGEISGYFFGYSGRELATKSRLYLRMVDWVRRWGVLTIFIFSLVPFFPFDLAGIAAGVLRFSFWRFLLVCWVGRTVLYIGVAWGGAMGWEALQRFLG